MDGRTDRQMDGETDGWMDGRSNGHTDGRTANGRTDGQMDGQTDNLQILKDFAPYRGRCPTFFHENQENLTKK